MVGAGGVDRGVVLRGVVGCLVVIITSGLTTVSISSSSKTTGCGFGVGLVIGLGCGLEVGLGCGFD